MTYRTSSTRRSALLLSASLLLTPVVGLSAAAPAWADAGAANVVLVAEPGDDGTGDVEYRDEDGNLTDRVYDQNEGTNPLARQGEQGHAWWPWIFPIAALGALAYLISQVLRKRRLAAEGLPDESEMFREQVLNNQTRDVNRIRRDLEE